MQVCILHGQVEAQDLQEVCERPPLEGPLTPLGALACLEYTGPTLVADSYTIHATVRT